jgi:hypothetical protein
VDECWSIRDDAFGGMIARARERRGRDDRGAPGETLPPARSIASQEWSIRYRVLVHGRGTCGRSCRDYVLT